MIPQIKPNRSACLVTAFAMTMDMPVEQLIEKIGFDGMEMQWPQYAPPYCYRGISVPEIIDVIFGLGFSVTEISSANLVYSKTEEDGFDPFAGQSEERLRRYIHAGACVLTLDHPPHAVACNIAGVIDPDTGERSSLDVWMYRVRAVYAVRKHLT